MSQVTRRIVAGLLGVLIAVLGLGGVAVAEGTRGSAAYARAGEDADLSGVPGARLLPSPAAVLPALGDAAPTPTPAVLAALLQPLVGSAALGHSVSYDVVDAVTGQRLAGLGPASARVPASTAKLVTSAAALSVLGPAATVTTSAVLAGSQEVTLVGGGDVVLGAGPGDPRAVVGRAGLGQLAAGTAAALRARGVRAVSVSLDDTLFAGPAASPAWRAGDTAAGYVAPVQSVEVDEGIIPGRRDREADPALAAASRFAQLLRADGIAVAHRPGRRAAATGATVLAQVRSASVAELVEHALTMSDNTVAEALARLVAVRTGRPATFDGAGQAVLAWAGEQGLPVAGSHLGDGSGLGEGSVLTPAVLTGVLALAASPSHPQLRPLLSGLPVAGVSGTLADRFGKGGQRFAEGLVRAKTGTLMGVSSLAGTVVDADGRLLAFAVMADAVTATGAARTALDSLVTTIAGCGCR